jgi:hypothetical protein
LANVYDSGGQDMYREQAITRAKDHFSKSTVDKPPPGGGQGIFRGQFNRQGRPCITFNLGKSEHPAAHLDANGRCKFCHKCDQWVSEQPDGTKGGVCGSFKHGRANCDNPKKAASKVSE